MYSHYCYEPQNPDDHCKSDKWRELQLEPLPPFVFYGHPFTLTAYYRLKLDDVLQASLSYDGGKTFPFPLADSPPMGEVDGSYDWKSGQGSYTWKDVIIPKQAPDAPVIVVRVSVKQQPMVEVLLSAGLAQSRHPGVTLMWNPVPGTHRYHVTVNDQRPHRTQDPYWSGDLDHGPCVVFVKAESSDGVVLAEHKATFQADGVADLVMRLKLKLVR